MEIKPILAFAGRLSRHQVLTAVLATLALVCPGIWALWIYDLSFIESATTPKLLLIATSIAAPVLLMNTIASHLGVMAAAEKQKDKTVDKTRTLMYALSLGSITTLGAFGVVLLLCGVFGWTPKTFILLLVVYEGLLTTLAFKRASMDKLPEYVFHSSHTDQAEGSPEQKP